MANDSDETVKIKDLCQHFERVSSVYCNDNLKHSAERKVKQSKPFSFFSIKKSRHKTKKVTSNTVNENTPESSDHVRVSRQSSQDSNKNSKRTLNRNTSEYKGEKRNVANETTMRQRLPQKPKTEPYCEKVKDRQEKNRNGHSSSFSVISLSPSSSSSSSSSSNHKSQLAKQKQTQKRNTADLSLRKSSANEDLSLHLTIECTENLGSNRRIESPDNSRVEHSLMFEKVSTSNEEESLETFNCDEYRKNIFMEIDIMVDQMQQQFSSENLELSDGETKQTKRPSYTQLASFVEDDFESDILEQNGENYIVEAFNDVGNELVITYLDITRKSVNINANSSFSEQVMIPDEEASIILHKTDCGSNYKELLNKDESIPKSYGKFTPGLMKKLVKSPSFESASIAKRLNAENTVNCNIKQTASEENICNNGKDEKRSVKSMPSFRTMVDNLKDENCEMGSNDSLVERLLDYDRVQQLPPQHTHPSMQEYMKESPDEDVQTRRSTVCDNSGNVRIEKYIRVSDEPKPEPAKPNSATISRKDSIKRKIDYIVEELVQTEDKYVSDLRKIVLEYKPYLEKVSANHKSLSGKAPLIFGNIDVIYDHAKQFCDKLKTCNGNIDEIGKTFINFKPMFELYPLYLKNKAQAVRTLKEFQLFAKKRQADLGDRLDLSSYLLTPIQRLGKYILLLEKMLDWQTEDPNNNLSMASNISNALKLVRSQMRKGNDSIAIESIKRCPIDLSMQGSFILTESFLLHKPKKIESSVFLFEKIVVFTVMSPGNASLFVYIGSIYLSDICIASFETHPTVFHLSDFPKNKKNHDQRYTFVLEAKTHKIKETWTHEIEKLLWKQLEKVKDQTLKQQSEEARLSMKIPVKGDDQKLKQQSKEKRTSMKKVLKPDGVVVKKNDNQEENNFRGSKSSKSSRSSFYTTL